MNSGGMKNSISLKGLKTCTSSQIKVSLGTVTVAKYYCLKQWKCHRQKMIKDCCILVA